MNEQAQAAETTRIEESIERIEGLYRAITGTEAPQADAAYAPIPAEKDPARHVEERLDHLLALLGGDAGVRTATLPSWAPPVTVWETEAELVVCVDLPGIAREDVAVTIQGNALMVSGRRALPSAGEARFRLTECATGPFRRTVVLSEAARGAEPRAQMKDGVLEIRVRREAPRTTTPTPITVH